MDSDPSISEVALLSTRPTVQTNKKRKKTNKQKLFNLKHSFTMGIPVSKCSILVADSV